MIKAAIKATPSTSAVRINSLYLGKGVALII
jgi:hypothetical protein